MIAALTALLSIESVSGSGDEKYPYGAGPAMALEHTLALCRRMGFRTKNADGHYGYAEIGSGPELIGILAHLDTVPAGSGWTYPPFAGTLSEGRLYGRGAQDDKGPVIACIYAMKELLDSGVPLARRIRLILGQDEETGEWADMELYKQHEQLPDCGFTPDGAFPAIFAEKGVLLLKLTAPLAGSGFQSLRGGEAPNMVADHCRAVLCDGTCVQETGLTAHGSLPWEGRNAITALMRRLATHEAPPPYAGAYLSLLGDGCFGEGLGCGDLTDDVSGRLSVNPGRIETTDGQICLYLDVRYPVTCGKETVLTRIENAARQLGQTVTCCYENAPLYMEKDGPLMQALLSAYREVTGDLSEPIAIGGGTYARVMKNIVAFGPGFPGGANTEHEPNEYITVDDLYRMKAVYTAALQKLLAQE